MSAASDPTRAQGLDRSMKGQYVAVRDWVREAAARMPEANYDFKPTPDVRSFGQLVGHIANSVAMICSVPMGTPSPLSSDAEKLPTKAALVSALDAAFSACDKSWAAVAPEWATAPVSLFGSTVSKMDALSFNNTHTYEHYGNVVTYLRLKGIVPPSSPR
jgi:uncharacterized damage-inducible protein DinB